jgi:altronate hydrolase
LPAINETTSIVELIACGCHIVLFTQTAAQFTGSAIAPVVNLFNPDTYIAQRRHGVNAGKVLRVEADSTTLP